MSFAEKPTLEQALDELKQGSLGPSIQSIENWVVDGEPAFLVTFVPGAEFSFDAMVIAPNCGEGRHPLFISARGADRKSFEFFLSRIRFIR